MRDAHLICSEYNIIMTRLAAVLYNGNRCAPSTLYYIHPRPVIGIMILTDRTQKKG